LPGAGWHLQNFPFGKGQILPVEGEREEACFGCYQTRAIVTRKIVALPSVWRGAALNCCATNTVITPKTVTLSDERQQAAPANYPGREFTPS